MTFRWDAVLRCQTWHVWPENFSVEIAEVPIYYGDRDRLFANLVIDHYKPRAVPAKYAFEPTESGPELPDDGLRGLYCVRGEYLKAPEDTVPLIPGKLRHAHLGELDLILDFEFDEEPIPSTLKESLRATALGMLSLLNLRLGDLLTPTMPFQVRRWSGDGRAHIDLSFQIFAENRSSFEPGDLGQPLVEVARFLMDPRNDAKVRTALELYAAHFTERQVRVRFLLLVIAMETLAKTTPKGRVALKLVARWTSELTQEKSKHDKESGIYRELESLQGQVRRLEEKSIGAQIAELFVVLPGIASGEHESLKLRAKNVYNKRSKLVHDGFLPPDELPLLEREARELIEIVFRALISGSEPPEGKTVELVDGRPQ